MERPKVAIGTVRLMVKEYVILIGRSTFEFRSFSDANNPGQGQRKYPTSGLFDWMLSKIASCLEVSTLASVRNAFSQH